MDTSMRDDAVRYLAELCDAVEWTEVRTLGASNKSYIDGAFAGTYPIWKVMRLRTHVRALRTNATLLRVAAGLYAQAVDRAYREGLPVSAVRIYADGGSLIIRGSRKPSTILTFDGREWKAVRGLSRWCPPAASLPPRSQSLPRVVAYLDSNTDELAETPPAPIFVGMEIGFTIDWFPAGMEVGPAEFESHLADMRITGICIPVRNDTAA